MFGSVLHQVKYVLWYRPWCPNSKTQVNQDRNSWTQTTRCKYCYINTDTYPPDLLYLIKNDPCQVQTWQYTQCTRPASASSVCMCLHGGCIDQLHAFDLCEAHLGVGQLKVPKCPFYLKSQRFVVCVAFVPHFGNVIYSLACWVRWKNVSTEEYCWLA